MSSVMSNLQISIYERFTACLQMKQQASTLSTQKKQTSVSPTLIMTMLIQRL